MRQLFIVDTPNAVQAAAAENPEAVLVTDNPHVALLASSVVNIDSLISQAKALELGVKALALTADIDRSLNTPEVTERFGIPAGALYLTGTLSRLTSALFHRGAALAAALQVYKPESIALFAIDAPLFEPASPLMLPRFAHPARRLSENGFFGEVPFEGHVIEAPLPESINDTKSESFLRRALLLPAPAILAELGKRLGVFSGGQNLRVVVAEENETIRETIPWLLLKGIRPEHLGPLTKGMPRTEIPNGKKLPTDPDIANLIQPIVAQAAKETGQFNESQAIAISNVIVQSVFQTLSLLPRQIATISDRLDKWFPKGRGVLLTNGLYGPAGAAATLLAQEKGVHVLEFEHGVTASIAALTQFKFHHHAPPAPTHHFLSSRQAQRGLYASDENSEKIHIVGLPDQTRRLQFKFAQRFLARRSMHIAKNQPVVFYACTIPMYANHRPGFGTPGESVTVELNRDLIRNVFNRINKAVIFKDYPTQRFPFENSYPEIEKIAENVIYCGNEDFRYIRTAADVVVTSTPTSTFGWCVGLDVPLVWLGSKLIHPLATQQLEEQFRESFLFVDMDKPGWQEELRELLNRPLAELKAEWAHKKASRDKLYLSHITGPDGCTGKKCAEIISALYGKGSSAK